MIPIKFKDSVELLNYIRSKYKKSIDRRGLWNYRVYITEGISLSCDSPVWYIYGSNKLWCALERFMYIGNMNSDELFKLLSNRFLLDKFIKIILEGE